MFIRSIDWRVRSVGAGIFLTNSLKVFEVNSSAAKVFLMCDGKHSLEQMVEEMKLNFATDHSDDHLRNDVEEVLGLLKDIGAVRN
jgi:hypothetical protein